MELFGALGLDIKIFIAQFVNFGILFFVLYKFVYGPVFEFLENRRNNIEKGVKNAEDAETRLIEIGEKEKVVLAEAVNKSHGIVLEAETLAKKNTEVILGKARKDADDIKAQEKKKIEVEREQMMRQATSQISELVISATEKILEEKIDTAKDKVLIDRVIKEVTA